nr:immunoglobulin heavy chain junction region [Macaca mulatta]MOW76937.1 immunoglobulin heavy chain junction region [Macaca mulatta]MOW77275.1 immunoglobulin heavy chain junction region [Macaca mulatta]MOW77419.1 immunoglobulin heavy chain junction region [Macaca mulatta]MOW79890.1 immunoglobulin heavy chain junction region [Macaca mulatta]
CAKRYIGYLTGYFDYW